MKTLFKIKDFGRQGDIVIRRIKKLPNGKQTLHADGILAHGESTGHCHKIEDLTQGELLEIGGRLYVKVTGDRCRIIHDEHDPIPCMCERHQSPIKFLPNGGLFEVPRQREYSPEEIRNVAD